MIKTQVKPLTILGHQISFDYPKQCPICNGYGAPTIDSFAHAQKPKTNIYVLSYIFKCHCCDSNFYMFYEVDSKAPYSSLLLHVWPSSKPTKLPDFVDKVSPRAARLFVGSENAMEHGHIDLAGTGFRNCLEILIKDFAVKEISINPETFKKQTLYQVIDKYLPSMKLKNTTDVVRILGNGFTHYENEYSIEDLLLLRRYFDIAIKLFEGEYLANHPEVQRDDPFTE